jgi:tRNA (guanine26-N2/guanine27-N2)-dimethyltransferase
VFYNPDMALDRDLDVAFATAHFGRSARRGWDLLAATGVRGLRLLVESGAFASFVLSEAHPAALEVLERNARAFPGAVVRAGNAAEILPDGPFDLVEVDPYGSPVRFLPAAFRAVGPDGVVAITATDLMVLAGVQPGACERIYGSRPVRGRLGPEGGLRILLAYLARSARSEGRRVRPLLAYVRGHYLRAFVTVSPVGAEEAPDPVAQIDPDVWSGPDLGRRGPYGPMWLGPLFDPDLVARLRTPATAARPREADDFLGRLRAEAEVDRPFYYESNELARALGLRSPPGEAAIAGALAGRGFRFARTHARPEGFRTDAPRDVVEQVARSLDRAPAHPARSARGP